MATQPNTAIDEAAAYWRIRLTDSHLTPAERAAFIRWHDASAAHREAYVAMDRAWNLAGEETNTAAIQQLRAMALDYTAPSHRRWAPALAAGVGAIATAVALLQLSLNHDRYETAVGERSTVALSDGSSVFLNTATRIETHFSDAQREVRVLAGQALFEVAKDATRPFLVLAGDQRITAVGTAFDVRVEKRQIRVTLIEGKVTVSGAAPTKEAAQQAKIPVQGVADLPYAILSEAGNQLIAEVGGTSTVVPVDTTRETSWRQGRLIFAADRLADAVAEMNRYTASSPIVLADPGIGELKVSGVFRTGHPQAFAHALSQYFPLQLTTQEGAIILSWSK